MKTTHHAMMSCLVAIATITTSPSFGYGPSPDKMPAPVQGAAPLFATGAVAKGAPKLTRCSEYKQFRATGRQCIRVTIPGGSRLACAVVGLGYYRGCCTGRGWDWSCRLFHE